MLERMRERHTLSNRYIPRLMLLTTASKPGESSSGSLILETVKVLHTLSASHDSVEEYVVLVY